MFDIDNLLTECTPFTVMLEFSRRERELDIVPHWYSGDDCCSYYIFEAGQELGTVISTGIEEWEWVSEPGLQWLALLIGDEIDWHYV